MRQNAQLLVDDGDSRRLRLLGRPQLTDMAGEADFSGVSGHYARKHIQEGGFAGTVFADERRHFASLRGECDTAQGLGAPE